MFAESSSKHKRKHKQPATLQKSVFCFAPVSTTTATTMRHKKRNHTISGCTPVGPHSREEPCKVSVLQMLKILHHLLEPKDNLGQVTRRALVVATQSPVRNQARLPRDIFPGMVVSGTVSPRRARFLREERQPLAGRPSPRRNQSEVGESVVKTGHFYPMCRASCPTMLSYPLHSSLLLIQI